MLQEYDIKSYPANNIGNKMRREGRSSCLFGRTLDLIGDRWSLLLIRDMLFDDKHTYGEFQASAEGIATNILAARLVALEEAEIITKEPLRKGRGRYYYSVTHKGVDLVPVMIEMFLWASRYFEVSEKDKEHLAAINADKEGVINKLINKHRNGTGEAQTVC